MSRPIKQTPFLENRIIKQYQAESKVAMKYSSALQMNSSGLTYSGEGLAFHVTNSFSSKTFILQRYLPWPSTASGIGSQPYVAPIEHGQPGLCWAGKRKRQKLLLHALLSEVG